MPVDQPLSIAAQYVAYLAIVAGEAPAGAPNGRARMSVQGRKVKDGGDRGAVTLTQVPQSIAAHDAVSARLIDALVEARILISGQDQNQTPTVALAHQRVVEAWRSARKIVADSEGLLRNRDEVENARQRWELSGQRRDRLIAAGLPLSEAENAAMTLGDELPAATRT